MSLVWQRFRKLSALERSMFFRVVFLLPMTTCALRFLGLRSVQRLMDSWSNRDATRTAEDATEKWRVTDAARRMTAAGSRYGLVRGNCLSQSMVLWHLLRRQGLEATMHVGGRKQGKLFEAHAWVELEDRIINDSESVRERFAPFEVQVSGAVTRKK